MSKELTSPVAQAIQRLRERIVEGSENDVLVLGEIPDYGSGDPELADAIARSFWAGVDKDA